MQIQKLLMLFLMIAPVAQAKTLTFNQARSVEIIGDVDASIIKKGEALIKLADQSKAPIDILINSFGGSVMAGQMFTQAMDSVRSRGIKLRCTVGMAAASMAFTIFTHCDERYALQNTRLLFHPPYYPSAEHLNTATLQAMLDDLSKDEVHLLKELVAVMGITTQEQLDWLLANYAAETWWKATDLLAESPVKWFEVVDDVKNCPNLYRMKFSVATQDFAVRLLGR